MTKRMTMAWLTGLALAIPALATAQPAAQTVDPDVVEERIERAWKADAELKACELCDIDVEFDDGVAILTGEVPTEAHKNRAEKLARIDLVTRVDNRITLDARTTGEKVQGGLEKATEATADALAKTGEIASDTWITAKLKAKLTTDDAVDGSDIEVTTRDNRVTLKGTVPSEAARAAALRIARETDGVKTVVDKLRVRAAS